MSGNATMNIWLGKQFLGQTDKVETHNTSDVALQYFDRIEVE